MNALVSFLVLTATLTFAVTADNVPPKCTWQNCPKIEPDQLNVHIICHTHDDLGWLKTVDQYYYGSEKQIVEVGVQYILNTVIKELEGHPDRRFSYAETGFFWRWYMNQHDFVKHQVKKLVNNGQLEFIGGGWAQNDEAASHYVATIDQMTLGLGKLNQTFGECGRPKVAWQIDPFGHSREQASLFAQMGYDALFFARIHYLEKEARLRNKSLEFVWNGSDDLKTNILTGAFYNDNYGPPPGYCFDALCGDDPIMDNPKMEGYNVDQKVNDFIAFVKEQASHQRTNHVMVLMGSDFQYTNADTWYSNLDKLIRYVNDKQSTAKVNLFYSTPSCYVQALNAAGPKLPSKSDDFFPYASANHSYWTGFFSSRPTFKAFVRQSSALLQVCKQLDTNADLGPADLGNLDILMRAVALSQHHDAITGTAKENVTRDYEKRLFRGWMEGQQVVNDAAAKLMPKSPDTPVPQQVFCPLSNISMCEVTKTNGQFTVTVFNGQAKARNTTIRIPYYWRAATVNDFNGAAVSTQVIKTFAPAYQLADSSVSPYELIIPVQVGPLGYATYFVSNKTSEKRASLTEAELMDLETMVIEDYIEDTKDSSSEQIKDPIVLQNELIQITFDASGLVSKFTDLKKQLTVPLKQEFLWYKGYGADKNQQLSGAYIFRPNGTMPIRVTNQVTAELITGPLVNEVRQTFSPWVTQVIRLYKGSPYAEFEWTVGPIPKEKSNPVTKEVITRFTTSVANAGVFYTDANGRQMVTRTRNQAAMYQYENTEPVAANYYPVNSRIYIKDDRVQMTILTDRSQGGASLADGQMELMIHRRSFFDDGFGVDEALDEPGVDGRGLVARGRHWLLIAPPSNSASLHRQLAYDIFHAPILTYAPLTVTVDQYRATFRTQFAGLRQPLPNNINLLTLEQWERRSLLVRLEHIFQNGEDKDLSQPTTVSLKNLFTTFDVVSVRELTLGANRELKSSAEYWGRNMNRWDTRYRWREQMNVELNPMQIRTFQIEVQRKPTFHHTY